MPFINIIVTNLDDIIALDEESAGISIARIAQKGNCCGVHVFVALRNIRRGRNNLGLIRSNIGAVILTPKPDDEDNFKFFEINIDADGFYAVFETQDDLTAAQKKLGI